MRALIAALFFACAAGASIAASADDFTDLRGVRIGMNATEMPTEGYRDLACETPEKKALSEHGANGARAQPTPPASGDCAPTTINSEKKRPRSQDTPSISRFLSAMTDGSRKS